MALAVSLLLLAGCGGSDEEPEGAIPQHQLDALKKAENVEDVMQQAQQKRFQFSGRHGGSGPASG